MSNASESVRKSYELHTKNIVRLEAEKEERLFPIKNKDTVSYQFIRQTLATIHPFVEDGGRWLTIGDMYGLEANMLKENGIDATGSDLTDVFLKLTHEEGLIDSYRAVNVESIPFDENSFDYVFCKEAYHHFPRAYLGLYEMVRVSKKGAILIEPIDILGKMPTLQLIKNLADRISPTFINKIWKNRFSFETVGNYVFKVSEREIEKMAMGLALPCIAFKGVNTEKPKSGEGGLNDVPMNKKTWKAITKRRKFKDLLCKLHLIPHNHLCCVLFSAAPSEELRESMRKNGYKILDLPANPYTS